jgi:hypothetical protein
MQKIFKVMVKVKVKVEVAVPPEAWWKGKMLMRRCKGAVAAIYTCRRGGGWKRGF